jgi:proteasome lid subunit RPN8/RPN11
MLNRMLEIPAAIVAQIQRQVFETYPSECCGLLFAKRDTSAVTRCVPLDNLADRYHALDPVEYPRTSRDAFMVNEAKLTKLVREAEHAGEQWLALYHSHIDCGAYFSDEDKKFAAPGNVPVFPDLYQLVIDAREDRIVEAKAFQWDGSDFAHQKTFPEFASPKTT